MQYRVPIKPLLFLMFLMPGGIGGIIGAGVINGTAGSNAITTTGGRYVFRLLEVVRVGADKRPGLVAGNWWIRW
jgi:hypothetical protein